MTTPPKVALITGVTGITGQDGSYLVASDLAEVKKHALLKQHGYNVKVNVE